MRCLLGVVEAGFFPGVIYYLTLWLPRPVRARLMAFFILAIPLSSFIGSPISAHLLLLDGVANLRGCNGFFSSRARLRRFGVAAWFTLADSPRVVSWLSAEEKETLLRELQPGEVDEQHATTSLPLAIAPRVWVGCPGLFHSQLSDVRPRVLVAQDACS